VLHGLAASFTTVSGVLAASTTPAVAKPITVIVSAGDLDRQNTPVPLTLPAELAGKPFELRGPGGRLPLDLDAQGAGVFVLPSLKKGKQARYQLHELKRPPKAAAGVEVVRDKDNVDVRVAGKRVLRYQADNIPPRPDIGPEFHRGGYLHPLFTPSGVQVTDDYPKDHKHHHGIWTAWTSTEYEGRKPDFWNVGGKKARKDHVSTGEVLPGAAAGRFTTQLSSTDLSATPPRQVLKETWKVTVYRTHAKAPPYYLFDLEWTDEIVGSVPLVLPQYRYGGLGVRGHIDWFGKDRAYFLTSEGKDRSNGEDSTARWVHMGGKTGETLAGIAVLDHPGNFRAPQPVRIHPDQPFLCYSPPKAGKMSLDPGKPYTSRYRFVVADGAPDKALLERLWNDYAHPPAVEVKPAAGRS
jgi:hypothetical protein